MTETAQSRRVRRLIDTMNDLGHKRHVQMVAASNTLITLRATWTELKGAIGELEAAGEPLPPAAGHWKINGPRYENVECSEWVL